MFNNSNTATEPKKNFWRKGDHFLDLYFYHDRDQQIRLRVDKVTRTKESDSNKRSNEGKRVNKATEKRRGREYIIKRKHFFYF